MPLGRRLVTGNNNNTDKIMKTIKVKRIENRGVHGEYPALRNTETGMVYVDTTLAIPRFLKCDSNGENIHGDFVGYNIPGCWHTFKHEPECPIKRDVVFVLE